MIGINYELLDRAASNNPVKIGLIGSGQMGTDVVAETSKMQGIRVVVTADVDLERAIAAYKIAGIDGEVTIANTVEEADESVAEGRLVSVRDYRIVTNMKNIDVMLEATGIPEIGTRAALLSACTGQNISMMNVETDITVGPLLNWYAKRKGVLYALAAGDEPAACKELYDFADSLGFTIVAVGKGKNNPLDRHATPEDPVIKKDASRRGLSPNMLIEFIDGSKTMIEMAAVSNATGLVPDVRGMHGPNTDQDHLNQVFSLIKDGGILNKMGVVDYGVGHVAPGVFLVFRTDHPRLQEALILRDMGKGPYYSLLRPYHLCSIEVPLTCAMLAIRKKSNMVPLERLTSEVFAIAKRKLEKGEILDGIGGKTFYGLIDTYEKVKAEKLLPVGLAKGAQIIHPVNIDSPITYDDVEIQPSTILELRLLQDKWHNNEITESVLLSSVDLLINNQK